MSRFLDARYSGLAPYTPGAQPQTRKYIKLNTNESPYPPSPRVKAAITGAEIDALRLYSDPSAAVLGEAIAEHCGLAPEYIIPVAGSDEALGYAFMAYCSGGRTAVYPDISYGFYKVFANFVGAKSVLKPLDEQWRVVPEDYYEAGGTVIIANPNAPTGLKLSLGEVSAICGRNPDSIVLIDEAYADFSGESAISLLPAHRNLLVVQTFSKSRCLAGARIGFAAAAPEIIADLNLMKFSLNPYDLDRLAIIAGTEAVRDEEYFRGCVSKVIATRDRTTAELRRLGCEVLPSNTNFIFVKPGIGGKRYFDELEARGILTRFFPGARTGDWLRVTIGSDSDMDAFLAATKEILSK